MAFEYTVLTTQQGVATHRDGEWLGSKPATAADAADSCDRDMSVVNALGREGWRLVQVVPIGQPPGTANNLYLERETDLSHSTWRP